MENGDISLSAIWNQLGELRAESGNVKDTIQEIKRNASSFQQETRNSIRRLEKKIDERNGTRYKVQLALIVALAAMGGEEIRRAIVGMIGTFF